MSDDCVGVGAEVVFGHYVDYNGDLQDVKWMIAEKLADGTYALQSEGVSCGYWPGYVANGYKDYNTSFIYKNIAGPYDTEDNDKYTHSDKNLNLTALYAGIRYAEAPGGFNDSGEWIAGDEYKNGLYLLPFHHPFGNSHYNLVGNNEYLATAFKKAASNKYKLSGNVGCQCVWMGSPYSYPNGTNIVTIETNGSANYTFSENAELVIAPTFNIDASKVSITVKNNEYHIVPKGFQKGGEYEMGTFVESSGGEVKPVKWICADVNDEYIVMQSEGITNSIGPAVNGATSDSTYTDISSMNSSLKLLYHEWKSAEANGGRTEAGIWKSGTNISKDGLYLIGKNDIADILWGTNAPYPQKGMVLTPYYYALHNAAGAHSSVGTDKKYAWLGTFSKSNSISKYVWTISVYGSMSDIQTTDNNVLAPAFNLDPNKVNVIDGVITKKAS